MSNEETKEENELPPGWSVRWEHPVWVICPAGGVIIDGRHSTALGAEHSAWVHFGIPRADFLDTLAKAARCEAAEAGLAAARARLSEPQRHLLDLELKGELYEDTREAP